MRVNLLARGLFACATDIPNVPGLSRLDARTRELVCEASLDRAASDPRFGADAVWQHHFTPASRIAARLRLIDAFDDVLIKNNLIPGAPLCLVFDTAGRAVQEKILIAHAQFRLGTERLQIVLCDRGYADARPELYPLTLNALCHSAPEPAAEALARLARDHAVVLSALFGDDPRPVLDSAQLARSIPLASHGLYFTREDFFANRLLRDFSQAADDPAAPLNRAQALPRDGV